MVILFLKNKRFGNKKLRPVNILFLGWCTWTNVKDSDDE
jgi:hypothetical protein